MINWMSSPGRSDYIDIAVPLKVFIKEHEHKNLRIMQTENRKVGGPRSPGGPYGSRYVIHPHHPDVVIDMRHFLVLGDKWPITGHIVELYQLSRKQESAYQVQDLYSNQMGHDFFDGLDRNKGLWHSLRNFFEKEPDRNIWPYIPGDFYEEDEEECED